MHLDFPARSSKVMQWSIQGQQSLAAEQARDFAVHGTSNSNRVGMMMAANPLTTEQARQLVPGLAPEALLADSPCAALLIQGGLVLDPHRYLRSISIPSSLHFQQPVNSSMAAVMKWPGTVLHNRRPDCHKWARLCASVPAERAM